MIQMMKKMNRIINLVHKSGHSGHQLDTIQISSVTAGKFRSYKLDTISREGKAGIFETSAVQDVPMPRRKRMSESGLSLCRQADILSARGHFKD
jgi:hypothetical protein